MKIVGNRKQVHVGCVTVHYDSCIHLHDMSASDEESDDESDDELTMNLPIDLDIQAF